MKVYLGWSGEQSRLVANLLRDWLPNVLQEVEPWLASHDIEAGRQWSHAVQEAVAEAKVSIICATRSNIDRPWFSYEAGMASTGESRLFVLAFDMGLGEVAGPLSRYTQMTANRDGMFALLEELNRLLDSRIDEDLLARLFDTSWPQVERRFQEIAVEVVFGVGIVDRQSDALDRDDELIQKVQALIDAFAALSDRIVTSTAPPPPLEQEASPVVDGNRKPRMFVGSSVEGKAVAECIQATLEHEVEASLWSQEIFAPSSTTMESLVDVANTFDFAVIVMTADDVLIKRGLEHKAPRDNLLFEVGLFTGILGRARTFVVHPNDRELEFPSDFQGVTKLMYDQNRTDKNLFAAVGPACTRMKSAMGLL